MAWLRLIICAAFVLALLLASGTAAAQGVNRALLVGCDNFLSQPGTAPSSANNVVEVAAALSGGAMNLDSLVTRRGGVPSASELETLVAEAFEGADDGDVSYFYISTHGVWSPLQGNGDMALLLSDGLREEALSARALRELFDRVPGTKVLLIDACHSGAMIGKGVQGSFENIFAGNSYKVLCSSGGAEESWFWAGAEDGDVSADGLGYFSGALVSAISARGGYAADDDRDGRITLSELKRYLRLYHGASTVQSYPEEDDFVVIAYDASSFSGLGLGAVMDNLSFEDAALSRREPTAAFSFTMLRPAQVAYQLVYQRGGRWDFASARLIWDDAERFGAFGDAPGFLSPGFKERTITLAPDDQDSFGYALLQVLTISGGKVRVAASQVLCVPPEEGDPRLTLTLPDAFCPALGEELSIVVGHAFPCELTVTIETPEGETISRLASRQATRPQQLLPTGSTFAWTGLSADGASGAPGKYVVHVRAYVGSARYDLWSDPVLLAAPEG